MVRVRFSSLFATLAAGLLLVSTIQSQAANWRIVDPSTAGTARIHILVQLPKLGGKLQVRLDPVVRGSHRGFPLMITGVQNLIFGGRRLPLPLDAQFRVGRTDYAIFGSLKCSAEVVTASSEFYELPIPNDARLLGLRFYQQSMHVLAGSGYGGNSSVVISLGSLAELTLGR